MTAGPAPYPADTRAKGWRFELDHERIRQSDTWALAPPDIRPWLLMLWMVAWEQTPCGSLPADPNLIAAKLGMSRKTFDRQESVMLRGWKTAADGRFYHPVLTERVREMLDYRDAAAKRKADYRAKMHAERDVPQDSHGTDAGQTQESRGKNDTGTGTGTGTGTLSKTPSVSTREKSPKGRKRCPESFAVTAEMVGWAKANAPGTDIPRETVKFRNHEFAKAKSDWPATWQNWILEAFERSRGRVQSGAAADSGYGYETPADRAKRERVAELTGGLASRKPVAPAAQIQETIDVTARVLG